MTELALLDDIVKHVEDGRYLAAHQSYVALEALCGCVDEYRLSKSQANAIRELRERLPDINWVKKIQVLNYIYMNFIQSLIHTYIHMYVQVDLSYVLKE